MNENNPSLKISFLEDRKIPRRSYRRGNNHGQKGIFMDNKEWREARVITVSSLYILFSVSAYNIFFGEYCHGKNESKVHLPRQNETKDLNKWNVKHAGDIDLLLIYLDKK